MEIAESITLFFREGASDKQYRLELCWEATGLDTRAWDVRFAYGRRGSQFQAGKKTEGAAEIVARRSFRTVLEEKLAKGYKVEFVVKSGPSIQQATNYQAPRADMNQVARAVVRTSTPTTPKQNIAPSGAITAAEARRRNMAAILARNRGARPALFSPPPTPAPPKPKPAEPFGPVKRKIRLEGE